MKLTVCIGSSCHLKGARPVVEQLQELIAAHGLTENVQLTGAFCMGYCQQGVCVQWNQKLYSLSPLEVDSFFSTEVLSYMANHSPR